MAVSSPSSSTRVSLISTEELPKGAEDDPTNLNCKSPGTSMGSGDISTVSIVIGPPSGAKIK